MKENDISDIVKRWTQRGSQKDAGVIPERFNRESRAQDKMDSRQEHVPTEISYMSGSRKAVTGMTRKDVRSSDFDIGVSGEHRLAAEPQMTYETSNGRKGKNFLVPADEIRANKYDLSISRYKEIEHKEIEYEKPDVIMKKIADLESSIGRDVDEIQKMINGG